MCPGSVYLYGIEHFIFVFFESLLVPGNESNVREASHGEVLGYCYADARARAQYYKSPPRHSDVLAHVVLAWQDQEVMERHGPQAEVGNSELNDVDSRKIQTLMKLDSSHAITLPSMCDRILNVTSRHIASLYATRYGKMNSSVKRHKSAEAGLFHAAPVYQVLLCP